MSLTRALAGKRVLLVDDDADLRKMFRVVLESAGAVVLDAASAAEVVELLGATPVDALVLDWHLAGASPVLLLDSLEGIQPGLGARVVVVSGDPRIVGPSAVTGPTRPAHALAKPFRPADLVLALAELLASETT